MDIRQIISRVQEIEIRSKLLSNQEFAGEYKTAFKGRGMQFSEVRQYSYGDDVRHIDWNVSARMQNPYIKLFQEEREQTLFFLVDISSSVLTSIAETDRKERIAEMVAALAFSANKNRDKVGLLLFDTEVRMVLPPVSGYQQIIQMIKNILQAESVQNKGTDFDEAIRYFKRIYKKNAIVFLISDFINDNYENAVKLLSAGNDLIGVAVKDPLDDMLPDIGLVQIKDAETDAVTWIDTSSSIYKKWYRQTSVLRNERFKKAFDKARASTILISDRDNYIQKLKMFFHQRAKMR
ncbi:MAG: DUF58 domain-containing protein [Chitinophagales bacterium]|nr:DUF58 domain-containing protein [Chitinophagales bacterium]